MEYLIDRQELQLYSDRLPKLAWFAFDHDTEHEIVDFLEYPISRGWTPTQVNAIWTGTVSERPHTECLAMTQSWFVFGFLEAVFCDHVALSEYVKDEPDGLVLNTAGLRPQLLQSRFAIAYNPDALKQHEDSMIKFCRRTSKRLGQLEMWYLDVAAHKEKRVLPDLFNSSEFECVLRSVKLVAGAIQSANSNLADMLQIEERGGISSHSPVSPDQLHERGWCLSLDGLFFKRGSILPEYANLIQPTDRDHKRHKDCASGEPCKGVNVDPAQYQPKHIQEGCKCPNAIPCLEKVLELLGEGSIPLIDLTEWNTPAVDQDNRTQSLAIRRWENGLEYVAFSHVWVDGLGSDTETGLPVCQIAALQLYARRAAQVAFIWIDALCIPHQKPFRKKAIQMMSDVYRQGYVTVVINAGLKSHDLDLNSPATELGLRVLTSTWMHRLWTLPECLLSRLALFVFKKALCSLVAIFERVRKQRMFPIEYEIKEALKMYTVFGGKTGIPIGVIQRLLVGRDSIRLSDETLAVCPMLNLSIAELFKLDNEDRISRIWLLVGSVDSTIVFLICRRLTKNGFRWAPKSLMSTRGGLRVESGAAHEIASVTEEGLRRQILHLFPTSRKNKMVGH